MVVKIPSLRSDFSGFSSLAKIANATKKCFLDIVKVDFSDANWIDANMSAPLGVILSRISNDVNTVQPIDFQPAVEGILLKNLFLTNYGYPKKLDTYGTTVTA
jgi:hypothetical protein